MPIRVTTDLPARAILAREGIRVLGPYDPRPVGKPPLRVALLNLMPDKVATEAQFARLLAGTDFDVELVLVRLESHSPRHVDPIHMMRHYRPLGAIMAERFDGFIVTGAPIECLPFENVSYWDELTAALDWAERYVPASLLVCWAGQAALYHRYRVPKHAMPAKLSGVYEHRLTSPDGRAVAGFPERFPCPVSRHTETRREDLPVGVGLRVLAESDEAGLCLIEDPGHRSLYMFNHLEYDADTLRREYLRDRAAGKSVLPPYRYFPQDDVTAVPANRWHGHGLRLIRNWVDEIYATLVSAAA